MARILVVDDEVELRTLLRKVLTRQGHDIIEAENGSMAISMVSVATRLTLDGNGLLNDARIVMGSVAPTPLRARAAEKSLIGFSPSDELLERAANEASEEATPISDVRASESYRNNMTAVMVQRALLANLSELVK